MTPEPDRAATSHTDADLVAAAASGSESAFRALYRAYVRPVYWLAHSLVGTSADAEDVTQETFLAAWRKLPGLELAGDSLLPWLATICRFQSANRIRRQQRDRVHTAAGVDETIPAVVDVEKQVIDAALVERVIAEVGTLSPLDQRIFHLCAAEGYAYQAAADELGVSHGVVRNRLSRIRTQLRNSIEPEGT
ncbi:MAG: RNA polymerase subunit sigma-24 [Microbacterium sp. SCN 70-200]|uniref:RNA polymerase sigma factor n=1 Tax=unclassified Microbacterium TaxID=2609290 RepID=UPI00086F2E92|nr:MULTISPECIES: RNA polymerase sigma factor [unclassified Microbacterium]MBN9214431.1 RNA polymerase sigma factor [Microbacterium sp.]ODT40773.1 MAG: RNA polymerase subunit sigma-24 [Microbacterium sp. SCN 70-200]OJV83771.1 MAG: RNA polymerase subunit sigma-24 [Microbacterium sp. 70-16]